MQTKLYPVTTPPTSAPSRIARHAAAARPSVPQISVFDLPNHGMVRTKIDPAVGSAPGHTISF